MSDRHVVPAENGWQVEKENAQRPSAKATTQAEAIKRAVEIVANDGGGEVVVHGADGQVRETRTVAAGSETTGVEAAATAVTAGAKGAQVTAERVAEDVADDVAAATRRARAEIGQTVTQAGDALVEGTERAERVGADVGERLETASQRTGRYIHRITEQVAGPIDSVAHALNPVRVAGRTAGAVIAGALHVGGVVSRRGSRSAARGARAIR